MGTMRMSKGSGSTWLLTAAIVGVGLLVFRSQASADIGNRWEHKEGKFELTGEKTWAEYHQGAITFRFREVSRGSDSVQLHDASRGITVILGSKSASIQQGGHEIFSIPGRWRGATKLDFEGEYAGANVVMKAGDQGVFFFAISYTAAYFGRKEAGEVWEWGVRNVAARGTLLTERIDYRTDDDRNILIGWYNPTTKLGGFLAGTDAGWEQKWQSTGGVLTHHEKAKFRGIVSYIDQSMDSAQATPDWVHRSYSTNGYRLSISTARHNDTGAIAVSFVKPGP